VDILFAIVVEQGFGCLVVWLFGCLVVWLFGLILFSNGSPLVDNLLVGSLEFLP
jgi:hypothetical protein